MTDLTGCDNLTPPLRLQKPHILLVLLAAAYLAIGSCTSVGTSAPAQESLEQSSQPLLNSERIRQRFGSYGIDVIQETGRLRVSNLFSLENGQKITRTVAVVVYPQMIPPSIAAEHAEIKQGQSIGEVFTKHGWQVSKQNKYIGELAASPGFSGVYSSMQTGGERSLALHIYELQVSKAGDWLPYARIAEVHHPDYLNWNRLRQIYGAVVPGPGQEGQGVRQTLATVVCVLESFPGTATCPDYSDSLGLKSASSAR